VGVYTGLWGVYLYRLDAGEYSETKEIVLLE